MKAFVMFSLSLLLCFMIKGASAQWTSQTNPLGAGDQAMTGKVQFLNTEEGWINATEGNLLHTTNGGITWSLVTPFPDDTVSSISDPAFNMQFLDTSTGWVMKTYGNLNMTENGNQKFYPAKGAVVYYTTDGGSSWKKSNISLGDGIIGAQLQFIDASTGFASIWNINTNTGYIYKTTDGGSSWSKIYDIPASDETTLFYFTDSSTGWLTQINDTPAVFTISKTTDGGVSWTTQYDDNSSHGADTLSSSGAMQFVDAQHGWVVGPQSRIIKTADGGNTWIPVTNTLLGSHAYNKCVFALDAQTVWVGSSTSSASGSTHVLTHTTDGGVTWSQESLSLDRSAFSIYFTDVNHGWVTFDLGGIAAYTGTTNNKTVNIAAGGLSAALTSDELGTVKNLTITGTIDARDFKTMRDNMPVLASIDLSGASIAAYTGTEGTEGSGNNAYAANEIPKYAFFYTNSNSGKESLTSVILPSTVTSIGEWAFIDTPNLSMAIPASVTHIQEEAFDSSGSLTVESANPNFSAKDGCLFNKNQTLLMHVPLSTTNYTVPSTVDTIGVSAFVYGKIETVTIPTSVKVIKNYAFEYCNSIATITFPEGLKSIGEYALDECQNLTSVTLPSTLQFIHYCAFTSDPKLTAFTISGDNPYFSVKDGVLFNKDQTSLVFFPDGKSTDYQIPDGVTKIDTAAFEGSSLLQNVTIPTSVTTLEQEAFASCTALTSVTIPASVTSMGMYEFYDCTGLTSIYANASNPIQLGSNDETFAYVDKTNCTLYVPSGSKSQYQTANQWKDFTNMVEHTVTGTAKLIVSDVKVSVLNQNITVEGATIGEDVTIYSLTGAKLFDQKVTGKAISFKEPTVGIYIVKVGNQSFKI